MLHLYDLHEWLSDIALLLEDYLISHFPFPKLPIERRVRTYQTAGMCRLI